MSTKFGLLFFETLCRILRALPRVAKIRLDGKGTLTTGNMIACCNQLVHILVHGDELVLGKRLLLLSINQSFCNLLLKPARLDGIDDLQLDD